MGQSLRHANHDDLASIKEIVRAAYTPYISRIGREPGPMLDDYAALIAEGQVYVAESGGIVSGMLVLIPQGDTLLLDNVAVPPEAQGLGLGRLLLAFAERTARESGCVAIRLYTNETMTENIALYGRIGYMETHRAEAKGLRRVDMCKPLGKM